MSVQTMPPRIYAGFFQPEAFRLFWIKYVTGFDERQHCARCLRGRYSKLAPFGAPPASLAGSLDEAVAPFIYLCGVTARWETNFHFAIRPAFGRVAKFRDDRLTFVIFDAEQVPIRPAPAEIDRPAEFTTCRNWQFGVTHFGLSPQRALFARHE